MAGLETFQSSVIKNTAKRYVDCNAVSWFSICRGGGGGGGGGSGGAMFLGKLAVPGRPAIWMTVVGWLVGLGLTAL